MSRLEKRIVTDVFRSPMNPLRWLLTLSCGHETWVTSKARPSRREAACAYCPPASDSKPHGPPAPKEKA